MDRRNRNILLSLVLSIILHILVIFMIDVFDWLNSKLDDLPNPIHDEITVVFPENKPDMSRTVVENQNENEEVPNESNLLSDKNSRAKNQEFTGTKLKNSPFSEGNAENQNLSSPLLREQQFKPNSRTFNKDALTGKQIDRSSGDSDSENPQQSQQASDGSNQQMNQRDFSVEEVGALSLSTYAWDYAPYINKLKRKHSSVWYAPPAYSRLGIIHGQTVIVFEIARNGDLIHAEVIDHKGHESLETASYESIKAVFPFLPLPKDFPEETLTITATLIYPDLKKLYNERRR